MKRSLLIRIKEMLMSKSNKPWAAFETLGVDADGRVEFTMSWNKTFISNLKRAGYTGTTDEEIVQLFFIATRMLPEDMMDEDDTVNPAETPRLSSEANILRK